MLDFNLNLGAEPTSEAQPRPEIENVVIIGSGPGGLVGRDLHGGATCGRC